MMWDVVLQILTVLGVIALCLIGLVLAVLLAVLLIPVRYKGKGSYTEELQFQVRVTWLMRLVSVSYNYPQPGQPVVRLCGITLGKPKAKNKTKGENTKETEHRRPDLQSAQFPEGEETESTQPNKTTICREPKIQESTENPKTEENRYTSSGGCGKIKEICAKVKYYWELLRRQENQLFFGRGMTKIWNILKHIKPRKLETQLEIGTGEPDTTGYVLAIWGMLYPVWGNHINIVPDFEHKIFRGTWYARGRILLIVPAFHILRLALDRQLHELIKELKTEGN